MKRKSLLDLRLENRESIYEIIDEIKALEEFKKTLKE